MHCAVPVRPEAEQITIKAIFLRAVFDQKTDVDDVIADQSGEGQHLRRPSLLHQLHLVAFRIFHVERRAAIGAMAQWLNLFHAIRDQVAP